MTFENQRPASAADDDTLRLTRPPTLEERMRRLEDANYARAGRHALIEDLFREQQRASDAFVRAYKNALWVIALAQVLAVLLQWVLFHPR